MIYSFHSPFFCELPSAMNHAIVTLGSMHLAEVLNKQTQKLSESSEIRVHFPSPVQFRSVQSLSHVRLFVTPWIAAHQVSLSIINSQSLLKLMSIESVMPSNHLILCYPLLLLLSIFPASGPFLMSWLFASGGQSIGVSASTSVLPINTQN